MAAGYNLLSLELANGEGRMKEADGLTVDDESVVSHMVREMDRHNADLLDEREALLRLLQVPKKPYGGCCEFEKPELKTPEYVFSP